MVLFIKIISDRISDEIPDWIIKKCKDLLEMGSTSAFSTPAHFIVKVVQLL